MILPEALRAHDALDVALPDELAWRKDDVVFAEAKLSRKDQLQSTQKRWIAAALAAGVPVENLLIVEWTFAS